MPVSFTTWIQDDVIGSETICHRRTAIGVINNPPHTHTFNGPFSGTTQVSRYQKGRNNLDFTEARDSEWQWYQLGHMQVGTSLLPVVIFPAAQPTASKH